ncbi:MAG TPA: rod shape-determining protein MreC [Vicinamibacterales bacterium]|nr:rod shape-determining protein MreC [Vicinamibacterales bacterium]
MALIDIRQRSGYLFIAVMLGHVLLISAQVNSRGGVPLLEFVTFGIFSEVQRAVSGGVSGIRHGWGGYVGLRHLKGENDALKRELATAQVAVQEQRALASRARGLEKLLELRDRTSLQTTAAEIIGAAAIPDFWTVTIDKGTRDGLRRDMAVIAPAGVVGRIVVTSARSAKVQLLVDRNAAAGALVERSRAQGVAVGLGGERLELEYVSEVYDVVAGDVVVTSGIDGIYPKGFVIGRVEAVERSGGAYKKITVRPAVDFSGLEEVLVVVTPTPAKSATEGASE